MFEKEARKWVKEHTKIDYKASYGEFPIEPSAIKSFKAGAEFGYNKAKEEMQKNGLALQSDMDKTIEQNIQLKKEIEKMTKEELKEQDIRLNRLCFDYQEKEKRIAELEKELEQAKKVQVVEHFEAYGQCRDSRRIASLEKENAELKEINADLKQSLDWANEREREDVKRITELEKENAELKAYNEKLLESDIEKHNKIAELEKEISNLLSCKNCTENKGGYICQKEYEDKCLAQKIQYIKELQEENADIKEKRDYYKDMADTANKVYNDNLDYSWYLEGQLTQAKDLLKKLCDETRSYINDQGFDIEILTEAEQFLKESE